MLPRVSCLCPTFCRTSLLGEAIESFLRQDYPGEKELVVLNDFPRQKIRFEHPEVRVVNLRERCTSLGEKRNTIASLASGDLLLTWGDDDIHLPHRISRMVSAIGNRPMMLEGWHYILNGGSVKLNRFPTTGAHIIKRSFLEKVGGFSPMSFGEDADFNKRAEKELGYFLPHAKENPAFLYRWSGTQRPHISSFQKPDQKDRAYELMLEKANELILFGKEPLGKVDIASRWDADYEKLLPHTYETHNLNGLL